MWIEVSAPFFVVAAAAAVVDVAVAVVPYDNCAQYLYGFKDAKQFAIHFINQ